MRNSLSQIEGRPALKGLVAGIGNPSRGDDGAGPALVARMIAEVDSPILGMVDFVECLEPDRLIESLEHRPYAILVDALVSSEGATTPCYIAVEELDPANDPSSHGLGAAFQLKLGKRLGLLPDKLIVIGIPACNFDIGTPTNLDPSQTGPTLQLALDALRQCLTKSSDSD